MNLCKTTKNFGVLVWSARESMRYPGLVAKALIFPRFGSYKQLAIIP